MKAFIAALSGGSVACAAVILIVNIVFGSVAFRLEPVLSALAIGLVVTVATMIATSLILIKSTRPSSVGTMTMMGAFLAPAVFVVINLCMGLEQSYPAILTLAVYGCAAGLGAALSALAVTPEKGRVDWGMLACVGVYLAALTVGTLLKPDAPLFQASNNVVVVTKDNFASEVEASEIPVLVDFSAKWCGPCKRLAVELEKLSAQYKGKVKVVTVDVDDQPELKDRFEVESLPTMLLYKGGKQVDRQEGYHTLDQLKSWIFGK